MVEYASVRQDDGTYDFRFVLAFLDLNPNLFVKDHSGGELAGFIPKGLTRGRTHDAIQDQFEFLPLVANGQAISLFHPDNFSVELPSMHNGND